MGRIKRKKLFSSKGAQNELIKFVKESFRGDNEIKFFISERGNQRIEITDRTDNDTWQTLEAVEPVEDMNNYDDISIALIESLRQQI